MLSSSPDRYKFQLDSYLESQAKKGLTPDNDRETLAVSTALRSMTNDKLVKEMTESWQKNNMEYDLRSTDWILQKARQSEVYSQNLYAAMCNNSFQKLEVIPILQEEKWSCSWRYAGGIIADMRQDGDYINWYCSGIKDSISEEEWQSMTDDQQRNWTDTYQHYVPEGKITEEIRTDLHKLGWVPAPGGDWEEFE